jgi:hypothetical protein
MLISLSIFLVPSPGRGADTPIVRLTSTAIGIVRRRLFEKHVFDCLTYCVWHSIIITLHGSCSSIMLH